jgi:hypothetical protein
MSEIDNMVTSLQNLSAKNALGIATQGTSAQRLAKLAQAGVAPGTVVIDSVTGQPVQVVSVAVAYFPTEVLGEVS